MRKLHFELSGPALDFIVLSQIQIGSRFDSCGCNFYLKLI
ncbi:hypothetical protein pb186bvf_006834 [Paramecium bursaria]